MIYDRDDAPLSLVSRDLPFSGEECDRCRPSSNLSKPERVKQRTQLNRVTIQLSSENAFSTNLK